MATVIDAIIHLTDQFTPNLTHIREELSETERTTRRSAREVSRLGESVTSVGEAMLPAAAAIAGGIGVSVKQFADFESIITQAGLKADATAEQIKAMGDAVIAAGTKYPVSINETAKAMDRLAAGGFNAEQSIAALAPVIQAAVASGEDMATVSDVVTSALSTWHLLTDNMEETTKNAETVADVIQMASNKSKLGVQDIATAFQYAAAPASALGDNVQTVSAILAVMANNGIVASAAGTSLRNAYLQLTAGAKPAREAIEKLGLQVFKANGEFQGMRPLLDQLRTKMQGMSEAEATPILKDLFGTEGVSAVLAYINTAKETTDEMFDFMEKSQGSSAAAFGVMSNTLSGQIAAIQGAFEAFVIRIGEAAAPMLAPFVAGLQRLVETLNAMPDEQIQTLIQLGIGFVGLTAGVLALGKALSILGSISSFLAPIGTALARGSTLTSLFMARLAPIGTVLNHIKNVAVVAFNSMLGPLRTFGGLLIKAFRSPALGWITRLPLLGGIFAKIGAVLAASPILPAILAIAAVATIVISNWKLFQNVAEVVWNKIKYVISQVVDTLSTTFQTFKARMGGHFDALVRLWKQLTTTGESSGSILTTVVNTLGSVFTGVFTVISTIATWTFSNLETLINTIMGVFVGLIKFITGVFTGDWRLAFTGLKEIVMSIFGGVVEIVENTIASVEDAIARLRGHEGTAVKQLEFERQKKAGAKATESYSTLSVDEQLSQGAARHSERNKPGGNALGTDFWKGGFTWVHEQGAELIDLPTGTRIIPHSSSLKEEYNRGFNAGTNYNTVNKIESENFFEENSSTTDAFTAGDNFVDNDITKIVNEGAEYANDNSVSNITNGGANYFESNPLLRVLNEVNQGETVNNENNSFNSYYYNSGNDSNIRKAEPTGNPSSKIIERQDAPKPPVNVNVQIPKLAEQIIVREKSDINDIVNQLVYRFQAHAINRVVHAVR